MRIALAFLFSLNLYAATMEKVNFPDTMEYQGQNLVLNGLGIRLATWFNVKVYVAGLYIEKKSSNPDEIFNFKSPKYISLKFLRDVDKDSINGAWEESIDDKFKTQKEKLKALMQDIKEKQELAFGVLKEKVVIKLDNKILGEISGAEFSRAILNIYIGPKPPNEELKSGMLGK